MSIRSCAVGGSVRCGLSPSLLRTGCSRVQQIRDPLFVLRRFGGDVVEQFDRHRIGRFKREVPIVVAAGLRSPSIKTCGP